jgi:hypothetical protein
MRQLKNNSGFALVISLFVVMVLVIYGGIFVLRTVNEQWAATQQNRMAKAYYVAEAGAETGLDKLDALINTDMRNTISGINPQQVAKKASDSVKNKNGLGFLTAMVSSFAAVGDAAAYQLTQTFGEGSYIFVITVRSKGDPYAVAQDIWDFPFNYKIESTGQVKGSSRIVTLAGDFTVRVQKDNFAKYALFSDHHTMKDGKTVWFTHSTNFQGPVHTNEQFSFAGNSSRGGLAGIFEGLVTQQLSKAQFYNNGSAISLDADKNGTRDVPVFNEGFLRKQALINLPSAVQKADLYLQAYGSTSTPSNGIYIPNNGTELTAGIFVKGDATIEMAVDGDDNAEYTITQGASTKKITVDLISNQTYITVGGTTTTYAGVPFGKSGIGTIIYVNGDITSLGGTIQRNTELTISSERDVIIEDHIRYSDYTAAVGSPGDADYQAPNADGTENVLGIISWGGDIRVGTDAPEGLDVHGVLMAHLGQFMVDGYDQGDSRGICTLLGGSISQFYGPFGQFNAATGVQTSGFGRNFVYDGRMLQGKTPPYFPTLRTFVAFTNDITDNIVYWEGSY